MKIIFLGAIFFVLLILLIIIIFMMFPNFFSKKEPYIVELEVKGNPINNFYYSLTISQEGRAVYSQGTLFNNGKVAKKETKKSEKTLDKDSIDNLLNEIQKAGFFEKDFQEICLPDTPSVKISVKTPEENRTVQGCMNEKFTEIINIIYKGAGTS